MKQGIGRAIASVGIVAAALAAAAGTAEAQYTATANTGVVTFTGSPNNDTPLTFVNAGGFLSHNRATAGDPAFATDLDMDTLTGGTQTVLVSSLTSLTINAGAGDDTVILTGLTG